MSNKGKQIKPFYFTYFEQLYESWEKSASKAIKLWFNNPLFNNCMERAFEKSTEFKNYTREIIEKSLNYRYLPIKNDFLKLTNSLENVEIKLLALEDKVKDVKKADETKTTKKRKPKPRRKKS
ncbi:hypothetical protein MYX76_09955 [Desulfobacterota bacterium AH_259_B03_O07]|nr:hypothetical protein [Desulfobacterota bacterium AH_259_B03_O07]